MTDDGPETWILTKLQERKLGVVQQSTEISFFNIVKRYKIRNEVMGSKTKVNVIIKRVQRMREQWAAYIARMSNTM